MSKKAILCCDIKGLAKEPMTEYKMTDKYRKVLTEYKMTDKQRETKKVKKSNWLCPLCGCPCAVGNICGECLCEEGNI